jgi:hypothetical protein
MSNDKILVVDPYLEYLDQTASDIINYYEKTRDNLSKNHCLGGHTTNPNNDDQDQYQDQIENYYDEDQIDEQIDRQTQEYYQSISPQIDQKITDFQSRTITSFNNTGIQVGKLNNEVKIILLNLVKKYAQSANVDYHPGSSNRVRDLVHPSVYPFIKGKKAKANKTDFWKRPYESSKYQWLPSEFSIDSDGKCKIESYINNLPIKQMLIYSTIECLFDQVFPELEKAWSYANTIKIYDDDGEYDIGGVNEKELVVHSLKNRRLQVITKIVQITLGPKEKFPGSWHVEGMSHENIVATASCTLEQEEGFEAQLNFKRTYFEEEAGYLVLNTPQYPPNPVSDLYSKSLVPVGKTDITDGSLVVFPNNFVHKIDMENKSIEPKTRTILVFWLINPNVQIKSTWDIEQQTYDWEKAKEVRLELMKERTFYKQTFNQREINLCEH